MAERLSIPPVKTGYSTLRKDLSYPLLQEGKAQVIKIGQERAEILGQQGSVYNTEENVQRIRDNTDIERMLRTLGLGFQAYTIDLLANTRAQIIAPAKWPRGYIIENPAEVTGFSTEIIPFASLLRVPATYNSAAFNVSNVETAAFWLDVTANAGGGTLTVAAQTQDPLSLNWAESQADIFSSVATAGSTIYAKIGPLGVDKRLRLQAIVGTAAVTFSVSGLLKGGIASPTGTTVYIGRNDVIPQTGFAVLAGGSREFFLEDNVELYAISPVEPVTIKVFQLQ